MRASARLWSSAPGFPGSAAPGLPVPMAQADRSRLLALPCLNPRGQGRAGGITGPRGQVVGGKCGGVAASGGDEEASPEPEEGCLDGWSRLEPLLLRPSGARLPEDPARESEKESISGLRDLLECEELRILMEHTERIQDTTYQVHGSLISNGEEILTNLPL